MNLIIRATCSCGMNNVSARRVVKKTIEYWQKQYPEAKIESEYINAVIQCENGHESPNAVYLETIGLPERPTVGILMIVDPKARLEACA